MKISEEMVVTDLDKKFDKGVTNKITFETMENDTTLEIEDFVEDVDKYLGLSDLLKESERCELDMDDLLEETDQSESELKEGGLSDSEIEHKGGTKFGSEKSLSDCYFNGLSPALQDGDFTEEETEERVSDKTVNTPEGVDGNDEDSGDDLWSNSSWEDDGKEDTESSLVTVYEYSLETTTETAEEWVKSLLDSLIHSIVEEDDESPDSLIENVVENEMMYNDDEGPRGSMLVIALGEGDCTANISSSSSSTTICLTDSGVIYDVFNGVQNDSLSDQVSVSKDFGDNVRFVTCVDIQRETASDDNNNDVNVVKIVSDPSNEFSVLNISNIFETEDVAEDEPKNEAKEVEDLSNIPESELKSVNNNDSEKCFNNPTRNNSKFEEIKDIDEVTVAENLKQKKPVLTMLLSCFACLNQTERI